MIATSRRLYLTNLHFNDVATLGYYGQKPSTSVHSRPASPMLRFLIQQEDASGSPYSWSEYLLEYDMREVEEYLTWEYAQSVLAYPGSRVITTFRWQIPALTEDHPLWGVVGPRAGGAYGAQIHGTVSVAPTDDVDRHIADVAARRSSAFNRLFDPFLANTTHNLVYDPLRNTFVAPADVSDDFFVDAQPAQGTGQSDFWYVYGSWRREAPDLQMYRKDIMLFRRERFVVQIVIEHPIVLESIVTLEPIVSPAPLAELLDRRIMSFLDKHGENY